MFLFIQYLESGVTFIFSTVQDVQQSSQPRNTSIRARTAPPDLPPLAARGLLWMRPARAHLRPLMKLLVRRHDALVPEFRLTLWEDQL